MLFRSIASRRLQLAYSPSLRWLLRPPCTQLISIHRRRSWGGVAHTSVWLEWQSPFPPEPGCRWARENFREEPWTWRFDSRIIAMRESQCGLLLSQELGRLGRRVEGCRLLTTGSFEIHVMTRTGHQTFSRGIRGGGDSSLQSSKR